MPPLPEGFVRGYYGGHVIVYIPRTSIILDVVPRMSISQP
jgi:hypothetical protein